jgi:hypothetical protein
LFLAVKTGETILSSRSIRSLLLQGADPNISNNNGFKPIDYVAEFDDHTPSQK